MYNGIIFDFKIFHWKQICIKEYIKYIKLIKHNFNL